MEQNHDIFDNMSFFEKALYYIVSYFSASTIVTGISTGIYFLNDYIVPYPARIIPTLIIYVVMLVILRSFILPKWKTKKQVHND